MLCHVLIHCQFVLLSAIIMVNKVEYVGPTCHFCKAPGKVWGMATGFIESKGLKVNGPHYMIIRYWLHVVRKSPVF